MPGGEGGGGLYLESYTREARFLEEEFIQNRTRTGREEEEEEKEDDRPVR
jgi:hypothetical protein